MILSDPHFWVNAWETLKSFNHEYPVNISILDFHILAEWLERGQKDKRGHQFCYYIDMLTLKRIREGWPSGFIRACLLLPKLDALPKREVFFIETNFPGHNETPLLVVLNHKLEKVLILGINQDYSDSDPEQESRHGSWLYNIWTQVANQFGWATSNTSVSILFRSWIHVCAHIVCQR